MPVSPNQTKSSCLPPSVPGGGGGGESGPSIRGTVGEVKAACGHQREDQSAASFPVSRTNAKQNLSKTRFHQPQPRIMGKETPQTPRT